MIGRLCTDPAPLRGCISTDLAPTTPVLGNVLAELKGELTNVDGARGFTTRRKAVDVLKLMQSMAAYRAPVDAQATVQSQRASLTGDAAAATDDLLARIRAATSPYFD